MTFRGMKYEKVRLLEGELEANGTSQNGDISLHNDDRRRRENA